MKKNDILIITGTALYSYLFFAQTAGINFVLFSIALIIFLLIKDNVLVKNKAWVFTAFGSLFTSVAVLLYGSSLSVIANILSLCLVASFSINRESSLLLATLYSIYSYISAVPFIFINAFEKKVKDASSENAGKGIKILLIIIPVFITVLFFFIYRAANPIFKNFTENLNFDFITWSWTRFTLLGFILTYAFFNHRNILYLFNKDLEASDKLKKENLSGDESKLFGKPISKSNENLSGIILLGLLNLLLLSVNVLDINFLWITKQLPEGLTYSEFVHQGIGLLIVSIIIAICIILFYFRGGLNFYENNKTLKVLAYFWIIQNALLILTTASRNQLYIDEYNLTYKRIGVYVYLLLSLIGLATTFIKILQVKSNWFLFRKNGWAFYVVLLFSCYMNWDMLISSFNIEHSKELDKNYLFSLSSTTLPDLLKLDKSNASSDFDLQRDLHIKTYHFVREWKDVSWQSWNLENKRINNEITELEEQKKITSLNLSSAGINTLLPIADFKNLRYLDLNTNDFKKLEDLSYFANLNYLNISSNKIDSLDNFPSLPMLKELNIANNNITNLSYLSKAPALEILTASGNTHPSGFPELTKLKTLDLSSSQVDGYRLTGKYNNLEHLKLNNVNKTYIYHLPHFQNLETLELRNAFITTEDTLLWKKIENYKTLKKLDLRSNGIKAIKSIPVAKMENIEELNLSANHINSLSGIEIFPSLKTLSITDCGTNNISPITDFSPLKNLTKLSSLNISGNSISTIYFLSECVNLKNLDLSRNKIEKPWGLGSLVNLEELNISYNYIYDIGFLKNLNKLKNLNLESNSGITDISVLSNLSNLEYLNIGSIPVNDISIFLQMKNLKHLDSSNITEEQIKKLKIALPQLETISMHEFNQDNYGRDTAAPQIEQAY